MKKSHKNWYISFVSFLIIWLVLGWVHYIWDIPLPGSPLMFGMAGSFGLLHAILLKMEYIELPDHIGGQRISDDETTDRNCHVVIDITTAILFYLSGVLSWYMHYEALQFSILLNAVLIIRLICFCTLKWVLKRKQPN